MKYPQKVWEGSKNRTAFVKPGPVPLSVDLHTQLFWRSRGRDHWHVESAKQTQCLAPADQLFHLIMNWTYQDNFVGLYKLLDIILLLRKYPTLLADGRLWELALDYHVEHILHVVFAICNQHVNNQIKSTKPKFIQRLPSPAFLEKPQNFPLSFIYWKHFNKSSLRQALLYDFYWLKAYATPF